MGRKVTLGQNENAGGALGLKLVKRASYDREFTLGRNPVHQAFKHLGVCYNDSGDMSDEMCHSVLYGLFFYL
jgi:hypothetical protein